MAVSPPSSSSVPNPKSKIANPKFGRSLPMPYRSLRVPYRCRTCVSTNVYAGPYRPYRSSPPRWGAPRRPHSFVIPNRWGANIVLVLVLDFPFIRTNPDQFGVRDRKWEIASVCWARCSVFPSVPFRSPFFPSPFLTLPSPGL
jgi:hypothetical protein